MSVAHNSVFPVSSTGRLIKPSTLAAPSTRTTMARPRSRTPCTTPTPSLLKAKWSASTPTSTQSAQWFDKGPFLDGTLHFLKGISFFLFFVNLDVTTLFLKDNMSAETHKHTLRSEAHDPAYCEFNGSREMERERERERESAHFLHHVSGAF